MKKKFGIAALAVLLLLILLVPIPRGSSDDGGTREWNAVAYRMVRWHRLMPREDGTQEIYRKTRFYFGSDRNASVDALWEKELRYLAYPDVFLDRARAEAIGDVTDQTVRITAIYADCILAKPFSFGAPIDPSEADVAESLIKLNGKPRADLCVGDTVTVDYQNAYADGERHRIEGELLALAVYDEPELAMKPVIYLYPEEELSVSVRLHLQGALTCTYPDYCDGWQVTASPNGILRDAQGQSYNYLYWEGELFTDWELSQGFCVRGADTAAFLEEALAALGLNRREANEFIVFWLPRMQENPYNIISFQTKLYHDAAGLEISPAPDTVIRVFMTYRPSSSAVEIAPQCLSAPERCGFTVVEWGGAELP